MSYRLTSASGNHRVPSGEEANQGEAAQPFSDTMATEEDVFLCYLAADGTTKSMGWTAAEELIANRRVVAAEHLLEARRLYRDGEADAAVVEAAYVLLVNRGIGIDDVRKPSLGMKDIFDDEAIRVMLGEQPQGSDAFIASYLPSENVPDWVEFEEDDSEGEQLLVYSRSLGRPQHNLFREVG